MAVLIAAPASLGVVTATSMGDCVVFQTLASSPELSVSFDRA